MKFKNHTLGRDLEGGEIRQVWLHLNLASGFNTAPPLHPPHQACRQVQYIVKQQIAVAGR